MYKTVFLLSILTAIFVSIGYLIGGLTGSIIAFIIVFFINFLVYWNSDKIVLSISAAKEINEEEYPEYYFIVKNLVEKAKLPMPKLYIINNEMPNAFATGRNEQNSSIAVNTGLLKLLSKEELTGVLAHEIAHIKHKDILITTITATFAGAISMIANFFMLSTLFGGFRNNNNNNNLLSVILLFIAPIFAFIVQLAISRDREYKADIYGGKLCGNPISLADALIKLDKQYSNMINNTQINSERFLSHLYIVNPFIKEGDSLFSTHPSTKNRVNMLLRLAKSMNVYNTIKEDQDLINNKTINSKNLDIPNNPWI